MNRNNYQRRNAKIAATRLSRSNLGVELLSRAADKTVQDKCAEIATALGQGAISGNASATRLLVDLAEGADWVQSKETVQHLLEVVDKWSKEPAFGEVPGDMPAGVLALEDGSAAGADRVAYVN